TSIDELQPADFSTTPDGTVTKNTFRSLNFGDTVRLLADYDTSAGAVKLKVGDLVSSGSLVYRYLGGLVSTTGTISLLAQQYATDTTHWQLVGTNHGVYQYMGSSATGANIDLHAQTFTDQGFWKNLAIAQYIPQGNNIEPVNANVVGLVIVLNDLRGGASAYINDATVGAGGDVTVKATETAALTAATNATVVMNGGSYLTGAGNTEAKNGVLVTN